jgi:hypothetical protein
MVKAAEEKGKISFSRSDCESWVDLPTDLIERAEEVGRSQCRDHSHPVFRLSLKASDDPTAQVLAALLASSPSSPTGTRSDTMGIPPQLLSLAAQAQVGNWGGSGFDSGCVRECQWSCGIAGLPASVCWWVCAWWCWPGRVAIGNEVRI